jgi:D-tyrosyl-tRNA(Tyr) deacylase
MRAVVQRVSRCAVTVDHQTVGTIDHGLTVLLGVAQGDTQRQADYLVEKIVHLRIFEDDTGKMNHSLADINGSMMVISQFTLLADCRKGRRPSFVAAAPPDVAEKLYHYFIQKVKELGVKIATGQFRAFMQVHLINEGPVTLVLESP